MHVVATAGHVDHGKSTLIRGLTGMEPDRWAEEKRRGMTIDLGYAWTTLDDGSEIAFVDVPGHQRFLSNMLAGIGPVPAVLLVIAADEGWSRQTGEHVAALDALGVQHGVLAITRSDLGDSELATEEARDYLRGTSLESIEAVAVSPVTAEGMPNLRASLQRLIAAIPPPPPTPTRLWVDRVFAVRGAGTVVTGTLATGSIAEGDELVLEPAGTSVRVRGIESLKQPRSSVAAVARVALNLRSMKSMQVHRGDVLVAPSSWMNTALVDVRLSSSDSLPRELVLHVGSAAIPVTVRRLGATSARLALGTPLPLRVGDRGLLRNPGTQQVMAGATLLDVFPPALGRRGSSALRAEQLAHMDGHPDLASEVRRRGSVRRADLVRSGATSDDAAAPPDGAVLDVAGWLIDPRMWERWREDVDAMANQWAELHPLNPTMPASAAVRAVKLPDPGLLGPLVATTALIAERDGVRAAGATVAFDAETERALAELELHLTSAPFDPPAANDLLSRGLTEQQLSAAARSGRLLRLSSAIYVRPAALDAAVAVLRELSQPFTLSEARDALATSRRVALPLLEMLDRRRYTRRIDDRFREVRPEYRS